MKFAFAAAGVLAVVSSANAGEPIRALILTGQNNHNWQYTSRVHAETLAATGRFKVDIADDAPAALADGARLSQYNVLVLDYNGPRWGEAAEKNFLSAVEGGTGVVIVHASNNAFVGWKEYEQTCGLMWVTGQTGHGDFHAFDVKYLGDHPIIKGLSGMKGHPDELYHNLINTQKAQFTTIAEAFSAPDHRGTGKQEPMAIVMQRGKGRVFHTPLGHVWKGSDDQKASISDPQFKLLLVRGAEWAATGGVSISSVDRDAREHNTLSSEETAAGWKLLFDGKSEPQFRGFKMATFPKGWMIRSGELVRDPSVAQGVGDIVTKDEYSDFEFACEWKVNKGGNSGIMYRSTEDHTYPWETGPEMQILDDSGHQDGKKPLTRAGTLYDVFPCAFDVCRPAGEWNQARIVAKGTHIEHWLNGFKVVDIDTSSDAYKQAVAKSKWTKYPDYNSRSKGHVALQDHGDEAHFRNIKVRELK